MFPNTAVPRQGGPFRLGTCTWMTSRGDMPSAGPGTAPPVAGGDSQSARSTPNPDLRVGAAVIGAR